MATRSVENFAGGKGGMISKLIGRIGPLAKLFGRLAPFIGKAAGLFGRFLPVVGPLILAFQVISGVMKKFGVDFSGVGNMVLNGLKKMSNFFMFFVSKMTKVVTGLWKGIGTLISKIPGIGSK